MSTRLYNFVRKFNFTSMYFPDVLRKGQTATKLIGVPEVTAAARWGIAGGLTFLWMIEHHLQEPKES